MTKYQEITVAEVEIQFSERTGKHAATECQRASAWPGPGNKIRTSVGLFPAVFIRTKCCDLQNMFYRGCVVARAGMSWGLLDPLLRAGGGSSSVWVQ